MCLLVVHAWLVSSNHLNRRGAILSSLHVSYVSEVPRKYRLHAAFRNQNQAGFEHRDNGWEA